MYDLCLLLYLQHLFIANEEELQKESSDISTTE